MAGLQFNVESELQIFEKLFHGMLLTFRILARNLHTYIIGHYKPAVRIIDLVSHSFLPEICWGNRRRNIVFPYFVLMTEPGIRTWTLGLISQHLIYWTTCCNSKIYSELKLVSLIPCSDIHIYSANRNKRHYCKQYFIQNFN